ncbi:hypothetical protein [Roseibacillus ishigakijimensis]|uniref:Uncharacterized protein n=1 Tax=Roseibacillus ishigakijimensis TaxID=454146 RepID=A0A934VMX6_9BACT|nr:hypothetical protein [Roseibacillus ishigakijimensis]MBK1834425.1 hypothetical protein [Roseibacillus ishigakijimensis]
MLQIIAWTGMLLDNSRENSMADAIEMTFDGSKPCGLCCAIAEAKEQKKEDPLAPAPSEGRDQLRLDLFPSSDPKAQSGRSFRLQAGPPAGEQVAFWAEHVASVPSPPPQRAAV